MTTTTIPGEEGRQMLTKLNEDADFYRDNVEGEVENCKVEYDREIIALSPQDQLFPSPPATQSTIHSSTPTFRTYEPRFHAEDDDELIGEKQLTFRLCKQQREQQQQQQQQYHYSQQQQQQYYHHHQQQQILKAEGEDVEETEPPKKRGRKGLAVEQTWTGEETEKLIALWSEREELYNLRHPKYIDRSAKHLIMKDIAEKLHTSEANLTKKMKSLHSYYLQKKRETEMSSDNGVGKAPIWPYYASLSFLSGNSKANQTICNVDTSKSTSSSSKPVKPAKRRKATNHFFIRQSELMEKAISAFDNNTTSNHIMPQKEKTDDEVFSEMVLKSIAKVPENEDKDELKIEILSLILRARRKSGH